MQTTRPITVHVHWSESDRFRPDTVMPFREFEDRALSVAMRHKDRGYLKTSVTVHFDDGSTYQCRLDLAEWDTHNFQHHIERGLRFAVSTEGQRKMAEWDGHLRNEYAGLIEMWKRMDFTPPPSPYAEELTPIGPQLVIPGCERKPAPTGKPAQLNLFG
jgi:hypothetical protein